MPLSKSHLYSAVRIIGALDPNVDLEKKGVIGTGFLMDLDIERDTGDGFHYRYVVTAAHVLDEQFEVQIQVPHPATGALGDPHAIKRSAWKSPLENFDLALAPWDVYPGVGIPIDMVRKEPLALGAVVSYVGILTAFSRPLAMVRSGTIAALDVEGLKFDSHYTFPAHLIDCRSYDGFSGSPCYSQTPFVVGDPQIPLETIKEQFPLHGSNLEREGAISMNRVGTHFEFIGMFARHTTDDFDGKGGAVNRFGIGVMLRAQDIVTALMSDELEQDRLADEGR
jgi:hypothetical protein